MESHIDVCMLVHYTMELTELYCTSIHSKACETRRFKRNWNSCDFMVLVYVYAWTDYLP